MLAGVREAVQLGLSPRWRRRLSLVAAYDREQRRGWGIRLATIYSWGIAVAYLAALLILRASSATDLLGVVVVRALGQLSLIGGGLVALAVARRIAEEPHALAPLLIQRAFTGAEQRGGAVLGAAYRVALVVGLPALSLSAIALLLSDDGQTAALRLGLLAAVAVYVLLLSLLLGPLAYWCAVISPERPRLLLAAVLLGPELAARVWGGVPSIPALFERLLELLLALSARS